MQGCYEWHLEATKQTQDVTTGEPPEDSVLVLQTYQIEIGEIQELSGVLVR